MVIRKLGAPVAPPKLIAPPKPIKLRAAEINEQVVQPVQQRGRSYTGMTLPPPEAKMEKGTMEVAIFEHTTDGRRELDRVCQEKGLMWGIVSTSTTSPGNGQPSKVKLFVLIGSKYEFQAVDDHGYPQAVDACLLGLAAELENE